MTYADLDTQSDHFAAYLQQGLGLKKGERIAIQMPNLLQFPVAFIGAHAGRSDSRQHKSALHTPGNGASVQRRGNFCLGYRRQFCHNLEKVAFSASIKHLIITELVTCLAV